MKEPRFLISSSLMVKQYMFDFPTLSRQSR